MLVGIREITNHAVRSNHGDEFHKTFRRSRAE
jgi:hypothetical protein